MPKGYYVKPMSCDGRYWYDVKRDGRWITTFKLESEAETFVDGAYSATVRWIHTSESLPNKRMPVLIAAKMYASKAPVILRAVWVSKHSTDTTTHDFLDSDIVCDYVEEDDTYYWPEGWYEWNECDETHWRITADVTHWMPLPERPAHESNTREK